MSVRDKTRWREWAERLRQNDVCVDTASDEGRRHDYRGNGDRQVTVGIAQPTVLEFLSGGTGNERHAGEGRLRDRIRTE